MNGAALIAQERDRRYGGQERLGNVITGLKRKMFEKEFAQFGGTAEQFAKLKGISPSDPAMAGIVQADKMKQEKQAQEIFNQLRQAQTKNYDRPPAPPTASLSALNTQYNQQGPNMSQDALGQLSGLMRGAGGVGLPRTNVEQNPLVAAPSALNEYMRPRIEQLKPDKPQTAQGIRDALIAALPPGEQAKQLLKQPDEPDLPKPVTPTEQRRRDEEVMKAEGRILENMDGKSASLVQPDVDYFNKYSDTSYMYKYEEVNRNPLWPGITKRIVKVPRDTKVTMPIKKADNSKRDQAIQALQKNNLPETEANIKYVMDQL